MGARDGRQHGEERRFEYHAKAMPAEVAKAEVAVLARQRVEGRFPSHRTTRIHRGRSGVGSSAAACGMAHRLSRLVLPRDCACRGVQTLKGSAAACGSLIQRT